MNGREALDVAAAAWAQDEADAGTVALIAIAAALEDVAAEIQHARITWAAMTADARAERMASQGWPRSEGDALRGNGDGRRC